MNNYIILKELNSGAFGKVVKAQHRFTKNIVAIKIESNNSNTLRYESSVYRYLNTIPNIPQLKDYFIDENNHYLVQELLDYNLKFYKKNIVSLTPIITNINIIRALINILRDIHTKGIVHRDIKPENICFLNNQIRLIDFGLAKKIINNNKHIEIKTDKSIVGTPNYVSLNIINGIEPSRRDDIESLIYILIFLHLDEDEFNNYDKLNFIDKKNILIIIDMIKDFTLKPKVKQYIEYCRNLQFKDKPDYKYLSSLFN